MAMSYKMAQSPEPALRETHGMELNQNALVSYKLYMYIWTEV